MTLRAEYHPPQLDISALLRGCAECAAFVVTLVAVVGVLAVSGVSLDALGYHYDTEGGSVLQKIHPATLLLAVALGIRWLARPSFSNAHHLLLEEPGLVVALASVVVVIGYSAAFLQVPVTPPIDSYLMPILVCLLMKDMSRHALHVIAVVVLAIYVVNDLTALYEYATGSRVFFVIPPDVTGSPEQIGAKVFDWKAQMAWDWRSTAMLGHPLENALLTGTLVMILQSRAAGWIPAWLRAGLLLLDLAAMVPFGGRAALALVIAMSAVLWIIRGVRALLMSRKLAPRTLAAFGAAVPVVIGTAALAYEYGAFDKFLERFVDDDGSAEARVLMWRLFEPIPWADLVTGPDQVVVSMWQHLQGLEFGIESFWAGMPLAYGLAMSAIIIVGWIGLFAYLSKATRREARLPILYFISVASTSAGLADKTSSLGQMAICILVVLAWPRGIGVSAPATRLPQLPRPGRSSRISAERAAIGRVLAQLEVRPRLDD